MLVISRRIGESFLIGDDIEATVVDITGEKVVLGISAPKSVPITRIEIADAVSVENIQAGTVSKVNMQGFAKLYKAKFPKDKK